MIVKGLLLQHIFTRMLYLRTLRVFLIHCCRHGCEHSLARRSHIPVRGTANNNNNNFLRLYSMTSQVSLARMTSILPARFAKSSFHSRHSRRDSAEHDPLYLHSCPIYSFLSDTTDTAADQDDIPIHTRTTKSPPTQQRRSYCDAADCFRSVVYIASRAVAVSNTRGITAIIFITAINITTTTTITTTSGHFQ